ncbi:hypothetical protein FPZ12_029540 [Amycolatopsis acidicola]|uniref:Terminase n=1 Tax=Amycolatopsis acidicola TaxID=2596893 RepID=A0A5N0UWV8_9PSEU|nr:hypothetical protein [Amycolatopsis acidicola]KAA9155541.1 hypothetical protein FPZ12_029540 [Amycolatopsis acidicola]
MTVRYPLPEGAERVRNSEGFVWVRVRGEDGESRWLLPADLGLDETIGWECIAWAEKWLVLHGEPLRLTDEQLRQILWASAVDTERQDFAFPVTAVCRVKGTGKDLISAIFCLFELCGNARPSFVDGEVLPTSVREPWVIVASTSLDATSFTSNYFRSLVSQDAIDFYGLDLGRQITYTAAGGRLESVTSQPGRIEGARGTFFSATEIGLWTPSTGGPAMWSAVERGAAKLRHTRLVVTSNAYAVGQGSALELLHDDYRAVQEGRMTDTGLNYDSLSAPADTDPSDQDSLRRGIVEACGDAVVWIDTERRLQLALAARTTIESTLRFSLNIPAAQDTAVYDSLTWDATKDEALRLEAGDTIALGLDVSLSDDSSALVAVRLHDKAAFLLEVVERPPSAPPDWTVNIGVFERAIGTAFGLYDVAAFFSDVNPIQGHVLAWEREYGDRVRARFDMNNAIAADMRGSQKRFTAAHETLVALVESGELRHDGNSTLRRHALNAHRRPNRHGVSFGKETKHSPKKVDAYAALLLALMAALAAESTTAAPVRRGRVRLR